MKAYSIANTELSSLKGLYRSSLYAFSQVEEFLRYKGHCKHNRADGCIDADLQVIQPIFYKSKALFRNRLRNQMRELIFIRLVSILEAYLVDTVRDVFLVTKKPFRDQTLQVGFTQAELLSARSISYILSKIINRECRRLTSRGFYEVIKYYKSRFNIDLASIKPGKTAMGEYHERRHLLVHRLGKTDAQYRKNYGFTGRKVSVDEEYLLQSFDDFEYFIDQVNQAISTHIEKITDLKQQNATSPSALYRIIKNTAVEPAIFNEEFQFWVGDELYFFKDIIGKKQYIGDREFELLLIGNEEVLRNFTKFIRRAEKKGHIVARILSSTGLKITKLAKLDEVLIQRVKESLPEQPWPKGIHKEIATKLNASNRKVSSAIQTLIQQGIFRQQADGKLIEE